MNAALHALGIDGGGSGCRALLADPAGRVVGQGTAGPANIASDLAGARAALMAAAGAAMQGHCRPDQVAAVLGVAGANLPRAAAALADGLPFARARVETDLTVALAGALGDGEGLLALIGTGSVFARRLGGQVTAVGGWGLVLGDEGSGAWIGRAACALALRAADGRAADAPLLSALRAAHGGADGLVAFAGGATPAGFAALVPRVLAAEAAGCPAAATLLSHATGEVTAALAHLQTAPALPVVLAGGLGPAFAPRLPAAWPRRPPQASPVEGALQLARTLAAQPG